MGNFKIGDWVRDSRNNTIFKISKNNFNLAYKDEFPYKLWKPLEGEYVWSLSNVLGAFIIKWENSFNDQEVFQTMLANNFYEPFIGNLPTFLEKGEHNES